MFRLRLESLQTASWQPHTLLHWPHLYACRCRVIWRMLALQTGLLRCACGAWPLGAARWVIGRLGDPLENPGGPLGDPRGGLLGGEVLLPAGHSPQSCASGM